jgi:hypothetical protein
VNTTVKTYADLLTALDDFARAEGAVSAHQGELRRAVLEAVEEFEAERDWEFLNGTTRVQLQAPYSTGTVAYTASTRALTLSADGTWPDWAVDGSVRIGDVISDVESVSGQVATLDIEMCPTDDIAAGTSYRLWPRWYALDTDVVAVGDPMDESLSYALGRYVSPAAMAGLNRWSDTTGTVRQWTVKPVPDHYSVKGLFVYPASDTSRTIDLPCKRRIRPLVYSGVDALEDAGTIAVTAGSQDVTGTDTTFESAMVGSILRISRNANRPTGIEGSNRYVEQRSVSTYTSATALTVDAAIVTTRSGVGYMITDPVDVSGSVYTALLRIAQRNLAQTKAFENQGFAKRRAVEALTLAKRADDPVRPLRIAGGAAETTYRLKDFDSGVR